MTTVIAINKTDDAHLAAVTAEMRTLGAPTIRCIRDDAQGVVLALEGSHRLAAAAALGLTPEFVMVGDDEMLICEEIGYDDNGWFDGEPARAADIRDRIAEPMGTYAQCGAWHHFAL
jgi:hypothetical protein